jgi:hypothetical protein
MQASRVAPRHRTLGSCASAAVAILVLATPIAAGAQAAAPIDQLRWMAGCWEIRTPSRLTQEQWMSPLGGMMLGMSRTVAGGAVREWEQIRIETRDARLVYVAQPSGQTLTEFASESVTDTAVVFHNPAHDFPQRVAYRRAGRDSLVARISGERGGRTRQVDFRFARATCPG